MTKPSKTLSWPQNIVRPAILEFSAYSARGGVTTALHLDANEAPWAPPPVNTAKDYNRYSEQQPGALRKRLADLYGVVPDQIMMGRGADEAIEILVRTFCEAGKDSILVCPPTFDYYETCAQIQGVDVLKTPLNEDYSYNEERINTALETADETLKIVFLCSPNNPTGNSLDPEILKNMLINRPQTLIVVDEAYSEFSPYDSFTSLLGQYRNLVVLRTLSKAYALAGVRAGAAIADPDVIDLMLKVLPPYPIPRPVEDVVLRALAPATMAVHEARLEVWKYERERVAEAISASPYVTKVYSSDTNFVLLAIKDEEELFARLAKRQVKLRDFRKMLAGHVRLSIGSAEENNIALAAFGVVTDTPRRERIGEAHRTTKETDISVRVNLDDLAPTKISTGIGFFDHMLESFAKHGNFGLVLTCKGDTHIDAHHSIEDCALALGTAMKQALGDKAGIGRFGADALSASLPMDETRVDVAIDLSGRAAFRFEGNFPADHAGDFPAEMCPHFFESLSQTLGAAIHITVNGKNTHHMIEACFKGVGRALTPALKRDGDQIPSTKGIL
jgi:histidinol-phosphate aminotransferase/imidazoleglycerol-phosphate dehydratase/histidinol-phosphatase